LTFPDPAGGEEKRAKGVRVLGLPSPRGPRGPLYPPSWEGGGRQPVKKEENYPLPRSKRRIFLFKSYSKKKGKKRRAQTKRKGKRGKMLF